MKPNKNKSKSAKTQKPLSTRATAARLFKLLHDSKQPKKGQHRLYEFVDQLINNANPVTPDNNQREFERVFLASARKVESTKRPSVNKSIEGHFAHQGYDVIRDTLARLDAGETLSDIFKSHFERKEQKQTEEEPNFADLARHISSVLNDPQTPVALYNALAEEVTDLTNGYLQSVSDSAPFIETCLIYAARGEVAQEPEVKTDAQQCAELARLIHALINHPKMSHDLRESIFEGLVTVQNDVGAREITESLQGIRATLEQYERRGDRGNDTTDLMPRNKREEAIVDDVLEHAEEIRAARAACDGRAKAIGQGGAGR